MSSTTSNNTNDEYHKTVDDIFNMFKDQMGEVLHASTNPKRQVQEGDEEVIAPKRFRKNLEDYVQHTSEGQSDELFAQLIEKKNELQNELDKVQEKYNEMEIKVQRLVKRVDKQCHDMYNMSQEALDKDDKIKAMSTKLHRRNKAIKKYKERELELVEQMEDAPLEQKASSWSFW